MEEPTMKYTIVKANEDGTEENMLTVTVTEGGVSTAEFAVELVQAIRDRDPEGDYRIVTVA